MADPNITTRADSRNSGAKPTVDDLICRALNTVGDLCHGRIRWTMHVPAEPDDPDLVITAGLKRAAEEINDLRLVNAELVEALEDCEKAIASLDEWDLGHGGQGEYAYPLRDELLHNVRAAIERARGE